MTLAAVGGWTIVMSNGTDTFTVPLVGDPKLVNGAALLTVATLLAQGLIPSAVTTKVTVRGSPVALFGATVASHPPTLPAGYSGTLSQSAPKCDFT